MGMGGWVKGAGGGGGTPSLGEIGKLVVTPWPCRCWLSSAPLPSKQRRSATRQAMAVATRSRLGQGMEQAVDDAVLGASVFALALSRDSDSTGGGGERRSRLARPAGPVSAQQRAPAAPASRRHHL